MYRFACSSTARSHPDGPGKTKRDWNRVKQTRTNEPFLLRIQFWWRWWGQHWSIERISWRVRTFSFYNNWFGKIFRFCSISGFWLVTSRARWSWNFPMWLLIIVNIWLVSWIITWNEPFRLFSIWHSKNTWNSFRSLTSWFRTHLLTSRHGAFPNNLEWLLLVETRLRLLVQSSSSSQLYCDYLWMIVQNVPIELTWPMWVQ